MTADHGFGFHDALRAIEASDPRWGSTGDAERRFDRTELERFAHAIAFVLDGAPRWTETVVFPGPTGVVETEVRVLTEQALVVASTLWSADDAGPAPLVRIRPLHLLRELDVDGFEYAPDGRPVGCTITLLFERGGGVRLGGSEGADRFELAGLLDWLRHSIDA